MESFKKRLEVLIDEMASGKPTVFAKKAGIPPGTFHNYISTGAIPKPEHLVRISKFSGASIDWLLTGEGPQRKFQGVAETGASYSLGDPLREEIIEILDRLFTKKGLDLKPKKLIELIDLLYEDLKDVQDSETREAKILKFGKLMAS